MNPDDLPYGPGQSDFEFEKMMDEQFERMTFEALVRTFQGSPTTEDLQILCYHAGMNFNQVKEYASGQHRRDDRKQVPETV